MSNQAKEPETGLDLAASPSYISHVAGGIPHSSNNASTTAAQVFSAAMERAKQMMSQAAFVQEHSLLAEQLQVRVSPSSPPSLSLSLLILTGYIELSNNNSSTAATTSSNPKDFGCSCLFLPSAIFIF